MKSKFSTPFLYPNRILDRIGNDRLRIASAIIAQEIAGRYSLIQTVELLKAILTDIESARRDKDSRLRVSASW